MQLGPPYYSDEYIAVFVNIAWLVKFGMVFKRDFYVQVYALCILLEREHATIEVGVYKK